MAVVRRLLQPPAGGFFLFGPRGTGKSTWLAAAAGAHSVVIDEIQKAPELLDVIHALIEEQPALRFVLTGSSARKLRHGAANLLGGRLVAASCL